MLSLMISRPTPGEFGRSCNVCYARGLGESNVGRREEVVLAPLEALRHESSHRFLPGIEHVVKHVFVLTIPNTEKKRSQSMRILRGGQCSWHQRARVSRPLSDEARVECTRSKRIMNDTSKGRGRRK